MVNLRVIGDSTYEANVYRLMLTQRVNICMSCKQRTTSLDCLDLICVVRIMVFEFITSLFGSDYEHLTRLT